MENNEEQQESNELEADGVLLGGVLQVQCAECEGVIQRQLQDGEDLADLVVDCPACTQKEGARVVVPVRVLVGGEVVAFDNMLAAAELAVDNEQPFATSEATEDGPGAP